MESPQENSPQTSKVRIIAKWLGNLATTTIAKFLSDLAMQQIGR